MDVAVVPKIPQESASIEAVLASLETGRIGLDRISGECTHRRVHSELWHSYYLHGPLPITDDGVSGIREFVRAPEKDGVFSDITSETFAACVDTIVEQCTIIGLGRQGMTAEQTALPRRKSEPDDCRESSTCLCNAWTQVLKCLDSESCQSSPTYAQASENVRGVCVDPSPLD
ncbi:hypothetical protein NM208_g9915 [Fusarium decemcellulare]|uniref:Uncharacterized protein n=1 Tax=Fusarium decemcellulare TaxID=57161 RepID=A0ACC1RZV6_9HYPO|nr:hypothetical protein NM208_g9915 [Fusarium decemcellulare]